jgi:hypothetical protein
VEATHVPDRGSEKAEAVIYKSRKSNRYILRFLKDVTYEYKNKVMQIIKSVQKKGAEYYEHYFKSLYTTGVLGYSIYCDEYILNKVSLTKVYPNH